MIPQRQPSRCSFRANYPSLGALFAVAVLLLVGGADGFRQRPFSATKSCQYSPRAHQDSHVSDIKDNFSASTSPVQTACLQLRGGSAVGVLTTLIRTAVRNPILVLLMASSTAVSVYEQDISYAKQLQSFIQVCIVGYVFRLLVVWQKMKQEAADYS